MKDKSFKRQNCAIAANDCNFGKPKPPQSLRLGGKGMAIKMQKLCCGALALLLIAALLVMPSCKQKVDDTAEAIGESIANADYEGMYNSCDSYTSNKLRSCYTDDDALALVGLWRTESGMTIKFDDRYMYLDALSFVLTQELADVTGLDEKGKEYKFEYAYNDGAIYIVVSKLYVKLLTAQLDGDTLTVRFSDKLQSVGGLDLSGEYVFYRQPELSSADAGE